MQRPLSFALLAGIGVSLFAATADACFVRSPQPVQVWLDHITVDVRDRIAVKTYDCTFKNPNAQAVVGGTCYMELEPGAQVDDMTISVNGKEARAEILDVEKANEVFQEIVREGGNAALLEYYGNQLVQSKIPRIEPNGTVTVKLRYTTVLRERGGLVRLQMLNTNPKASMQPLESASVTVNIASERSIKNVYSPTHEIKLVEKPDWDVAVEWSQESYLPTHPFVLYYQMADEGIGAGLVTHRELDEPGHFMMVLSPTIGTGKDSVQEQDVLPKDVVFVVDTSGSMLQDGKMGQARKALEYCVKKLRDGDRFDVVDFSTTAREFSPRKLAAVNDTTRAKALRYVEKLAARGGTAIEEALTLALDKLNAEDDGRVKMIVFATDGLPTIGEREPEELLKLVEKKNTEDVRLFVFGEGFDVNTKLLDFLALEHDGSSEYVLPEEDIEEKIAGFFDRVGSPIGTDLKLEIEGLVVEDVFPRRIADVHAGEQIVVFGRYTGHGRHTLRLVGNFGGKRDAFEYEFDFPELSEDAKGAFVPRLWAGQKVDFLLNEIRRSDEEDPELVDEVTHLAKRYGIVTPFTSFLVVDDAGLMTREEQVANFKQRVRADGGLKGQAWGQSAVTNFAVQAENRFRYQANGGASSFYGQVELARKQEGFDGAAPGLQQVRFVGNCTFYNCQNVWYDSRFDVAEVDEKEIQDVTVGTETYLQLLADNPDVAPSMAQGDVVLNVRGQWFRFRTKEQKPS